MALVYAENVIEIAVIQDQDGRPVVNVWHMWFDSELGSDTKVDVVGDFRDNWQDHMTELSTPDLTIQRFEWRSLDPGDASLGVVLPDGAKPTAGQRSGAGTGPQMAKLVEKNTDDRPRGARDGRCFIAGVPAGDVQADGLIAPSIVPLDNASLQLFYDGISDTSGAASGDRYPCVLETTVASRTPGATPVTINSRRVTSITLDPRSSSQRDRNR